MLKVGIVVGSVPDALPYLTFLSNVPVLDEEPGTSGAGSTPEW
jgi:hypothetical protein